MQLLHLGVSCSCCECHAAHVQAFRAADVRVVQLLHVSCSYYACPAAAICVIQLLYQSCRAATLLVLAVYNEHGVNTQQPTVSACYNGMAACLTALAFAHSEANPENVQVYLVSAF